MTLDQLREQLDKLRETVPGDTPVLVTDADGEYSPHVHFEAEEDMGGGAVLFDIT